MSAQDQIHVESKRAKSLKYMHGEGAANATSEAGNAYGPASLIAAGGSAQTIGLMSMLTNLVASVLYLKVPFFVEKMRSRKRAIVIFSFLDAIGWIPLAAMLFLLRPVNPMWLIPLWVINLVPGMLVSSARSSWLADVVPDRSKGKYLGTRSAISSGSYLVTFYVMGYVLNMFDGEALTGFALIFSGAFVGSFFCFIVYSRLFDPAGKMEKDAGFGFLEFLGETRTRNLGRFILFVAMLNFTVYLSSPFIASFLLKDLSLTYGFYALVMSTELLGRILTVSFWGRYADRVGNLKVLGVVALIIPFVPLLWLVSPSIVFLMFVQLVSGVAWGGFDLCSYNFIFEAAPQNKRLKYIVYHKALLTLAMAGGALAGAYLLDFVRPVMGHKVLALFLISGVLRFAVVAVMFPKLLEVRARIRLHAEQRGSAAGPRNVGSNQGLLHRPQQWAGFRAPFVPVPVSANAESGRSLGEGLLRARRPIRDGGVPVQSTADAGKARPGTGLFFRRNESGQVVAPDVRSISRTPALPVGKGLLHQRVEFGQPLVSQPVAVRVECVKLGNGLLHQQKGSGSTVFNVDNKARRPESRLGRGLFNRERGSNGEKAVSAGSRAGRILQPESIGI